MQPTISYPRSFMARAIFAWLFLVLVYFFATNSLLSQLQAPVLVYPGSDNSFWLLHILRLPQYLLQHPWAALLFDVVLTTSCLICVFVPQQRPFTWITVAGVWLLYVCYCTTAGKHYAQIGYLVAPTAFLALRPGRFNLSWELVRYWVCFLYVSAGIYKLWYGGFGDADGMANIVAQTHADWLPFVQNGWRSGAAQWLIEHPAAAQWFYRAATVVDLALAIGFFTKKFDKWLAGALVAFHVGNYLLLHISFVEQSLIFAPLLPWQKWAHFFQSIKGNDRPFAI
jgi:hypothetical protein